MFRMHRTQFALALAAALFSALVPVTAHAAPPPPLPGTLPVRLSYACAKDNWPWGCIADCESGGRWDINTGNGYWGGLQFAPSTWFAYGGGPFDGTGPFPYSADDQIAVATRVFSAQGPGAWPNCFQWK